MSDKKSGNMNFWKKMLSYYRVGYPNLAQLVKIIFAKSGGTSPLKRSYRSQQSCVAKTETNSLQIIWRCSIC